MFLEGHKSPVIDIAIDHHSNSRLATASEDCTARVWSASGDGVYKSTKALVGFEDAVVAVVWHPATTERLFLSCGGSVFLFDLQSLAPLIKASDALETWKVSDVEINSIQINKKGSEIAWCDDSGAVGILILSTGKNRLFRMKHANIASKVLYKGGKDGELLSGSYDGSALIWDTKKGAITDTLDLTTRTGGENQTTPVFVLSLAASPDAKKLAAGAGDGSVWQSSTRLSNAKDFSAHTGPVIGLAYAGQRLVSCSLHQLCIWKADEKEVEKTIDIKDLEKANCIAATSTHVLIGGFAKDGKGRVVVLPIEV
ncbi:hypothetical protein E3P99_01678 [Wallemia hederae]|uniref:Uncharacterized protein n=1 Tax=Wallemia hederae TaxID=1540922 RepID=A0A4T0FP53_9BASI|nr:hypothetical protein E3P99_01678 [Wallemia hederae]